MNPQTSPEPLWRKRLAALAHSWPGTRRGEVEALHLSRVALRRIREALPVAFPGANKTKLKKLSSKLRAITRALGPVRQLDVELGVLGELDEVMPVHRAALEPVRHAIVAERKKRRERMRDRVDEIGVKRLGRKLERLGEESDAGHERVTAAAWRNALAVRTVRRAKRLKEALDAAGAIYMASRIHDVRIAVKRLRYVLEMAEEAGLPQVGALIQSLKGMQKMLGRLNDLQSLLDRIRDVEASADPGQARLGFRRVTRSLEQECRRLHGQFVVGRTALSEVADAARHELAREMTAGRLRPARAVSMRRKRYSSGVGPTASAQRTSRSR